MGTKEWAALLTLCLGSGAVAAPGYDWVLTGARVMDPASGFDGVANVALAGDRIAAISEAPLTGAEATGARRIDARGLVLAPGFIDTHYHGTLPIHYRLALRNGVTSIMDLEFGTLGDEVGAWYEERTGSSLINFGTASSHELARAAVLDGVRARDTSEAAKARRAPRWSRAVATDGEQGAILKMLEEGLQAGALGVGSTLGYMPGVTGKGLYDIQALAGRYGRQISVHLRRTPGTDIDEINGAQEILANAVALKAPAMINHFNNPGWRQVHRLLRALQAQGHNVWGEIYPYAAGSTTINAVFFERANWVERLGRRYEDIFDPTAQRFLDEESFLTLRERDPTHVVIAYKMPEAEVVQWLGLPGTTLASDGLPALQPFPLDMPLEDLPNAHPRAAGTYAKALRLAREHGLPLMPILRQTSTESAERLAALGLSAMEERGRVQVDAIADLVLFDPATVSDHSTYAEGSRPATGFAYVFVAGQPVVKADRVDLGATPGRALRFPPGFAPMTSLSGLFRYPVKSMGGEALSHSEVGAAGLPGDRGWALSDGDRGAGQGAKRYPALMGYEARYLEPPGVAAPWPPVALQAPTGETRRSDDPALDRWLSDGLGSPLCLKAQTGSAPYFDDAPLLLMSEASLTAAAALSPGAGELRRFRPNFLVTGTEPGFPEDEWVGRRFRLGSAAFEVRKRCPRCVMTTLAFRDVPEDRSVLFALRSQRQSSLGVYLSVVQPGTVTLGDSLHWL